MFPSLQCKICWWKIVVLRWRGKRTETKYPLEKWNCHYSSLERNAKKLFVLYPREDFANSWQTRPIFTKRERERKRVYFNSLVYSFYLRLSISMCIYIFCPTLFTTKQWRFTYIIQVAIYAFFLGASFYFYTLPSLTAHADDPRIFSFPFNRVNDVLTII